MVRDCGRGHGIAAEIIASADNFTRTAARYDAKDYAARRSVSRGCHRCERYQADTLITLYFSCFKGSALKKVLPV